MEQKLIWVAAAVLFGAVTGFLTPWLADRYIIRRERTHGKDIDRTDRPAWERVVYCLAGAALFGAAVYYLPTARAVIACICIALLLTTTDIDNRCRLIPNPFVLALLGMGILYRLLAQGAAVVSSIGIALMLAVIMLLLATLLTRSKSAVGAGDVKLILVMAIAAGTPDFFLGMLAMAACMVLYSMTGIFLRKLTRYSFIPMGGCISVGFLASFFSAQLLDGGAWLLRFIK